MGKCLSKEREPAHVIANGGNTGGINQHASQNGPLDLSAILQNNQLKLQSTPNVYHPQNSFQSQTSHLNSSSSLDTRRKDFGEETVIALFPYESRSDGDLSFA